MSRAHLFRSIQASPPSATGVPSVLVCEAGTRAQIAATMYTDETNFTPVQNPFLAPDGVVDFYLDLPQDVCLVVTYGSVVKVVDYQSVFPRADALLSAPPAGSANQVIASDGAGGLAWASLSTAVIVDNGDGTGTETNSASTDNGDGTGTFTS